MAAAMTSIMSTGSACVLKAGSGVSAAFDDYWTEAGLMAESTVNCATRYDWTGSYAVLSSGARFILSDVVSSLVANSAIAFDMSGYPSRIVAEDMININRDTALRGLSILRDKKVETFIENA